MSVATSSMATTSRTSPACSIRRVGKDRAAPGTVYNYPLRQFHKADRSITGFPAPAQIAVQIYNTALPCNLIAKVSHAGLSIDAAIAWAENELEGFIG